MSRDGSQEMVLPHMDRNGTGGSQGQAMTAAAAAQALLHGLVAAGGWILFVYWWWTVLAFTQPVDAALAFFLIASTLTGTVIVTALWVRHNLEVHRRKGPRTRVPDVLESRRSDVLGRRLAPRPDAASLREARLVLISVHGEEKRLEPGEPS